MITDGPLTGFTVLDLTNVLAGPFCGNQLAYMGAKVIKVEMPGRGDLARQLGADPNLNKKLMGYGFQTNNAGKKSITLNLKHPKGKEIFKRLVAKSDVVLENFRPGVMERLGLGFETLKAVNDSLVYCAITGFGQNGPLSNQPAYDQIVQGISGVMSITGGPETAPYRVGYPLCDTIGGMTAAFGIAAALASRQRKGEATFIDVAMLEATLATMSWVVTNWLNFGIEPAPQSNDNVTSSPSGTFQAADKPFNIAANEQKQWKALCGVLGCQELVESEKFADREDRRTYRGELKERLEAILKTKNAADWVSLLNEAGVPSGLIMRVPEILSHPHIREREQIAEFKDVPGGGNRLRTMRPGLKLNGQPIGVKNPPVRLGENNADIFEELGIEAEELADLARQQII